MCEIILIINHSIILAQHPSLMVLMVMVISAVCFGIAKVSRYYIKQQKRSQLDQPLDLIDGFRKRNTDVRDEAEPPTSRTRYSKAQARQRFKRGKT